MVGRLCKELDEELDKYDLVELLGKGAYGEVFKAIEKSTARIVAIKIIKNEIIPREELVDLDKNSKEIKHHNIVKVLHYFHSSRGFCTVAEYAPQGNLSDFLKKEGGLSKEKTLKYAAQLVGALSYLHFKGIVHGDLKPQNILIYEADVIKICDFGLAPLIWKTNKNLQIYTGAFQYMAPEVLQLGIYHIPADFWSLGIVLYQLLGGCFPKFIQDGSVGVHKWHMMGPPLHYPLNISPDFKSFIRRLLNKNPADRRLEWPKFDSPLFVSETCKDFEARELRANTAETRVCDATHITGLTSTMPKGVLPLDWYEELSRTFYGAMSISQDEQALSAVLQPLKDKFCRVEDVVNLNISLKIISNIVDADAINSTRALEMFWALGDFTAYLIDLKKSDYNDLLEKCFIVVKKVMLNYKGWFGDLHKSLCIGIMDIFKKVAGCTETAYGEVLYKSIGFITVIVSEVAQDDLKEILDYAKEKGVVNSLLSCLILVSVSLDFFPAACEAFKAIRSLLIADGDECKKIIDAVTKAFLQSDEAVQYAFYICLRHSSEDVWKSVLQEKHKIVPLLVACFSDQDTDTRYFAGEAITAAAFHNELLHKELGRYIPQIAKSLISKDMGYKTKESACFLLGTLVIHSGKLCQDIIFEGALEALIILVRNRLLSPCNQPEEQSLLDMSLETLKKLCEYSYCENHFHSSDHYQLMKRAWSEARESKVAATVSRIFNKTIK